MALWYLCSYLHVSTGKARQGGVKFWFDLYQQIVQYLLLEGYL